MTAGNCDEAVSLINIYKTLGELCEIDAPEYVDGESLAPQVKDPTTKFEPPAISTWGRGNYTVRDDKWRYTRYFNGDEELYDHNKDPQEWDNLANKDEHLKRKNALAKFLPKNESPQIVTGRSLWNVIDADQPSDKLEKFKNKTWPAFKKKLRPAIENKTPDQGK